MEAKYLNSNIRLSHTKDPRTGTLEVLDEHHITSCASFDLEILNLQNLTCPFGLEHSVYVPMDKKRIEYLKKQEENGMEPVKLKLVQETNYQYKYNDYGGKGFEKAFDEHTARRAEWQGELGLNMYAMDNQ